MKHKRGWLRIFEAGVAILILVGVLLVVYARGRGGYDLEEQMYKLQKEVLRDISLDRDLRTAAFSDDEATLTNFADEKIPDSFNFKIRICDVTGANEEVLPCKMEQYVAKDVYVEEIILGAVFGTDLGVGGFSPKRVRLFIWEV